MKLEQRLERRPHHLADHLLCPHSSSSSRLQSTSVAIGESFPIPEIVAIGGQSDGKSSLLEAFLGVSPEAPCALHAVHASSIDGHVSPKP